jgi:hypothetical protein
MCEFIFQHYFNNNIQFVVSYKLCIEICSSMLLHFVLRSNALCISAVNRHNKLQFKIARNFYSCTLNICWSQWLTSKLDDHKLPIIRRENSGMCFKDLIIYLTLKTKVSTKLHAITKKTAYLDICWKREKYVKDMCLHLTVILKLVMPGTFKPEQCDTIHIDLTDARLFQRRVRYWS